MSAKLAEIEDGFVGHPEDEYYFVEAQDFRWLIDKVKRMQVALEKHHWPDLVPGDGPCETCGLDASEGYP